MTAWQLSQFAQRFLGDCGILRLMDDLGQAAGQEGVIMLGGGNPSHIPAVQQAFRHRLGRILDSAYEFEDLIGNYDGPGGNTPFVRAVAELFHRQFGWEIGPENVALTNGSQTAFFMLFNMFAGIQPDGQFKRILLPLAPEYIGYEDVGLAPGLFLARRPQVEFLGDHLFKYRVDFQALQLDESIGAICVSRPTNPTGNVLTEAEMAHLSRLAAAHGIPFIVDNAYGAPFPGIIYTEAVPGWEPHQVLCLSLSKLGLPGARTGIVIARPEIIQVITGMNAVISLAPGSFGAAMALEAVRSGEIIRLSQEVIRPHYQAKAEQALSWLRQALEGTDYFIHKPEGAFFFWLWFRGLPIGSQALYERLKARGVLVVPGHYFFPGLQEAWEQRQECLRLSYAGSGEQVHAGIQIIGEEVRRAYAGKG